MKKTILLTLISSTTCFSAIIIPSSVVKNAGVETSNSSGVASIIDGIGDQFFGYLGDDDTDITFTFSSPVELNFFNFWNDARTDGTARVNELTFVFLDENDNSLGTETIAILDHNAGYPNDGAVTYNFSTTTPALTKLRMTGTSNTGVNVSGFQFREIQFDGIVAPIPEPSSIALLGLGGLAFITRRKRLS